MQYKGNCFWKVKLYYNIGFAQWYFAVQTRKQEIIEDRIKLVNRLEARDKLKESDKPLSKNIYERGVNNGTFIII